MKKLTKSLLVAGAMIAANSAAAFVDTMCPLVGIDYQHAWTEDRGVLNPTTANGSVTSKSFPGATVYLGTRFCEYLGAELGWDWAAKRTRNTTFYTTAPLGNTVPVTARVKRQGAHFDIYTYLPVADCFELMLGTGIGYVTAKTDLSSSNAVFTRGNAARFGTFKPKGVVGRIRLGGNYMFDECIGLRALLGWESTGSLKYKRTGITNATTFTSYPFKDSLTAAVGLFYKF